MCPHTTICVLILLYVCPHTTTCVLIPVVEACGCTKHTSACVSIRQHTSAYVSIPVVEVCGGNASNILLCVLILLYMCPHTVVCVLILLYMCPHTTIYVSAYYCIGVLILLCVLIPVVETCGVKLVAMHTPPPRTPLCSALSLSLCLPVCVQRPVFDNKYYIRLQTVFD
jgi:hypothetical protein